jgi:hypothetical protein
MQWTVKWLRERESCCRERLENLEDEEREEGLKCYCYKQMALWRKFGDDAETTFSNILGSPSGE